MRTADDFNTVCLAVEQPQCTMDIVEADVLRLSRLCCEQRQNLCILCIRHSGAVILHR